MMKNFIVLLSCATVVSGFNQNRVSIRSNQRLFSDANSNTDMFGSGTAVTTDEELANVPVVENPKVSTQVERFQDEAARLRKEAEEMEYSLRDEARAKGLPEEMIKKLIPLQSSSATPKAAVVTEVKEKTFFPASEIRSKLGYLNTGDAVRFTSELDRIKGKGFLNVWNSKDIPTSGFSSSLSQLRMQTRIEPVSLKLDDVGYNYQNVFVIALALGTTFALGSSFIGGQLGFILGYLSALFPIALVGLGSIAPQLIGDVINYVKFVTDEEAKKKYIRCNAGKFLVGYILGLPISSFSNGGVSNQADFFQIRPAGKSMTIEERQMFAKNKFKQSDIARSSIVCLAGSVAECMCHNESSGTNANDVNTLYELINAVDPSLKPEEVQAHIRWSACQAYDILNNHRKEFDKVYEAFTLGLPLEECISMLEGEEKAKVEAQMQVKE